MWNPSQFAGLILGALSAAAEDKAIGRVHAPHTPFTNVEVVSSEAEGNDGEVSASITQWLTTLRVNVIVSAEHQSGNPYTDLDAIVAQSIADIQDIGDSTPADAGVVDLFVTGRTEYDVGEIETKEQFVAAAINVSVRHR